MKVKDTSPPTALAEDRAILSAALGFTGVPTDHRLPRRRFTLGTLMSAKRRLLTAAAAANGRLIADGLRLHVCVCVGAVTGGEVLTRVSTGTNSGGEPFTLRLACQSFDELRKDNKAVPLPPPPPPHLEEQ